jgi:hypothetical protein
VHVYTSTTSGTRAMVFVTTQMTTFDQGVFGAMSFEVIGPNGFYIPPVDGRAYIGIASSSANKGTFGRATAVDIVTLGAPGDYTFTAKYKVVSEHSDNLIFSSREMTVQLLPPAPTP